MFTVSTEDVQAVLTQFGITGPISHIEELLRYRYEETQPGSKKVRLIIKIHFKNADPLIMKSKHEDGVTKELLEAQTAFSEHLRENSIPTAQFWPAGGAYVLSQTVNGYPVFITLESYCPGEIKEVNLQTAEKTGQLLAATHNIAERDDCHVDCPVLFDPFKENDLFSYSCFEELQNAFKGKDADTCRQITTLYHAHMDALEPLRKEKRYAVQGDISDCNLFLDSSGRVGMFDFNRCGDNVLFCDALMQGVFESRLMDYGREPTPKYSRELLFSFLRGYNSLRPFSSSELDFFPHLYALIDAFWSTDLIYGENSLTNLLKEGRKEEAGTMLSQMKDKLTRPLSFNL